MSYLSLYKNLQLFMSEFLTVLFPGNPCRHYAGNWFCGHIRSENALKNKLELVYIKSFITMLTLLRHLVRVEVLRRCVTLSSSCNLIHQRAFAY